MLISWPLWGLKLYRFFQNMVLINQKKFFSDLRNYVCIILHFKMKFKIADQGTLNMVWLICMSQGFRWERFMDCHRRNDRLMDTINNIIIRKAMQAWPNLLVLTKLVKKYHDGCKENVSIAIHNIKMSLIHNSLLISPDVFFLSGTVAKCHWGHCLINHPYFNICKAQRLPLTMTSSSLSHWETPQGWQMQLCLSASEEEALIFLTRLTKGIWRPALACQTR